MRKLASTIAFAAALSVAVLAQQKENPMTHHAHGTFTVDIKPLTPAPAEGLSRFSINKVIHGDLEAITKGEMFLVAIPSRVPPDMSQSKSLPERLLGSMGPSLCSTRQRWMPVAERCRFL